MRCRALFVDDEPSIRAIYEMLGQVMGEDYIISTAAGPQEAKEILAREPADIIVSDLVMPGACGAEFLLEVSKDYPSAGRIAVSGFADQVTMAKCLSVAHRYFTKPFSPAALIGAIQQLHGMRAAMDERVAKLVGSIQSLPVPSETYLILTKALNSHTVSLEVIAEVVEKDPALCSKLLQAANSAMFGARERCHRMVHAIQLLGLETIRTLVLGIQVFELCPGKRFKPFLDRLWRHSLEIAQKAKQIREAAGAPHAETENAFLAGLLHDLGTVVLGASSPAVYAEIIACFDFESEEFRKAEHGAFGASHAVAGAYLLNLWGLPGRIVQVVAQHHDPLDTTGHDELLVAVQAAHEPEKSAEDGSARSQPSAALSNLIPPSDGEDHPNRLRTGAPWEDRATGFDRQPALE